MHPDNDARILDLPYCVWEWYPPQGDWHRLNCFEAESCFLCGQDSIPEELRGWQYFLPENRADTFEQEVLDHLRHHPDCHIRLHLNKNGKAFNLVLHAAAADRHPETGEPTRILGLCRPDSNDTGQVSAKEAFQSDDLENRRRLELLLLNADRFKGIAQMAGNIAHDLNNLLAPIRMATQLLHRKANDPALNRYVDIIEDSTSRARSVIQQILSFSKSTERGDVREVAVCDVLKELEKIACETFPKRIQTSFSCASGLPAVSMDPTQLHQAVLNMLINARDAIDGAGEIDVRAELSEVSMAVTIGDRSLEPGSYVRIAIRDTGCGMPPETMQHIFDPFFTTKPKEQGTGLGLASVYGIIARAGGFIDLKSEVGEGTTFFLYIPQQGQSGTNLSSS